MLDDPVTRSALIVLFSVFIVTLIAITVMYLLIRAGEKGLRRPPHKVQMWLAAIIGVVIPLIVLAYALAFSPSARLMPQQLHEQELQQMHHGSQKRY